MTALHGGVLNRWLGTARRHPDSLACRDEQHALSHGEFDALARRRAHRLRALGLRTEDRVAVLLHSGVDQAVWIAATMLAGGCAVPMGVHQPDRRLQELISLARPFAVITDERTHPLAEGHRTVGGADQGVPDLADLSLPESDQAAYICFTSGTTGRPKGVIVPHGSIAHTSAELAAYIDLAGAPRNHVLVTSWSFDVAMMDLWLALTSGGALLVPDRANLLGPALVKTLSSLRAPVVHGVPSLFGAFTEEDFAKLPQGTTVMLGGESTPATALRLLREHTDMHMVYGITETGVVSTTHRVTDSSTPYQIGRPLTGVDCVVVDEQGATVPEGEMGELLIGGAVVARGYLDDPSTTEARFVTDASGARRYRTGDLVRRGPAGEFTFHGRIDHQVKIRGHRVEPGEIERVLLGLPGVRQAAVVPSDDPSGERALVAYLGGTAPDLNAINAELVARLPEWMRPALLELHPELPTSVTGKIDRPRLPAPRWRTPGSGDAPTDAGESETERLIGGIWRHLLGTSQVGSQDNFVSLGGHSLKAAQLSTALRDRLGVDVTVADVLATPSLRELSALVDRAGATVAEPPTGSASPTNLPSAVQRQLWLHQELAGTAGIYNLVVTVDLRGPLRVTALQRALQAVEAAHPALRTRFSFDGEELTGVELPPARRPLAVRRAAVPADVRAAGRRTLDVGNDLPWTYHVTAADDRHVLVLVFHHIAVDGIALYRLLGEIAQRYSALVEPGSQPVPAVTAGRRASEGEGSDSALTFWNGMLADAPGPTQLPGQCDPSDFADYTGWCQPTALEGVDPPAVRAAAARAGVTPQTLMLASFVRWLARDTGTHDITIGVPVSRRGVDVDSFAIGQYASVLPVRFLLPDNLAARGCLEAVGSRMREAQRHSAVDPALVLEAARSGQDSAVGDPFRLVFAWEDEIPAPVFAGLDSAWKLEFNGWSEADLTVELADLGDGIGGRVVGRRTTSTDVDVDRLMRGFTLSAQEMIVELDERPAGSTPSVGEAR